MHIKKKKTFLNNSIGQRRERKRRLIIYISLKCFAFINMPKITFTHAAHVCSTLAANTNFNCLSGSLLFRRRLRWVHNENDDRGVINHNVSGSNTWHMASKIWKWDSCKVHAALKGFNIIRKKFRGGGLQHSALVYVAIHQSNPFLNYPTLLICRKPCQIFLPLFATII